MIRIGNYYWIYLLFCHFFELSSEQRSLGDQQTEQPFVHTKAILSTDSTSVPEGSAADPKKNFLKEKIITISILNKWLYNLIKVVLNHYQPSLLPVSFHHAKQP